jgi:prepilin-type processing-associated H-X9-DG protein
MQHCPTFRGVLHTDGTTGLVAERLDNLTDGKSSTLMIGERSTRTHQTRGTFWADSFNLYNLSGAYPDSATLLNDYDACSSKVSDVAQCKYGWGSFHDAGINFVFCDGHVATISRNINMKVFTYLATISGGEVTTDF